MRALIVNEPPARTLLQEYLEDTSRITVIGECGNAREAIEAINKKTPDLVFLDVQMPGLDGFDVLERIDVHPDIIFSTAYDQYATRAFDAGAVDYLLKPYSRDRLQTAIERAFERYDQNNDAYADRLAALLQEARTEEEWSPKRLDSKNFIRIHRSHMIALSAIDHLYSDGSGGYKVVLDEGTRLRVSRSYAPEIRDRLL